MMALLAYIIYLGINLESLLYMMGKYTYILQMKVWIINAIVPIGCLLMMICLSISFFNELQSYRNSNAVDRGE